jgi:hypothetical protein
MADKIHRQLTEAAVQMRLVNDDIGDGISLALAELIEQIRDDPDTPNMVTWRALTLAKLINSESAGTPEVDR